MKSSPQAGTRRSEGYSEFVVHLPDPKLLRVIARLILFATAIMSFPWLCNIFQPDSPDAAVEPKLVDDPFSLSTTMKKIPHADEGEFKVARRLLSVLGSKKEALEGLEDAFLEQPEEEEKKIKKINYLPDLMGDNWLVRHPRRVFVVVGGTKKRARNTDWFERDYPKKGAEFEIVKVDSVGKEGGGIGDWLEKNVRAEEFVVMEADADAVEEMVRGNVIHLVDELFMECDTRGSRKSRRAYWECLALYGRVRDEGVAVHQLWE
ncbi:uncharacterized protein M6B38_307955 [Iris pallida]|uniref:DUF7870 domain-containing protein n=1 Tax=Iris pallida TaxID=29817 RepID=A0AAX6HLG4_IRIPA|nr:uncharacterized protein M6B38_307955 [Iris pallida]